MTKSLGIRSRRMPREKFTDLERFFAKVEVGLCWEWKAGLTKRGGYAQFHAKHGVTVRGHRWLWKQLVDPSLPDSLDLDHLCRNHRCVNPDHLEPVTRAVNLSRGIGSVLNTLRKEQRRDYNFV